jgi:hypothetical protein
VRAAEQRVQAARMTLAAARTRLAARAVDAYVHGGRVSFVEQLADSDGVDLNVRHHYIDAAVRSARDAVDVYRRRVEELESSEQGLRGAHDAAQESVERVQANRDVVAATEAEQRANLRRVQGEIGVLVREQQQRDYAAALRRAERAARTQVRAPVKPAPAIPVSSNPPGGIWACIREKESGNNYRAPGGGAYQFQLATWQSLGGTGRPEDAPPAVQDAMAIRLQQRSGWSQWSTARACGAF